MSAANRISKVFLSRKVLIVLCSVLSVFLISFGCCAWIISEEKEVKVCLNTNEDVVISHAATVSDFLKEQDLDKKDVTVLNADIDSSLCDGQTVEIEITSDYTVLADGNAVKISAAVPTVGDVLSLAGISLGGLDFCEPDVTTPAIDDMVIDVHRVTVAEEIRETELAYSIETKKDPAVFAGHSLVLQAGQPGLQRDVYSVTYRDGEFYSEELISSQRVAEPVNEIVAVGNGESEVCVFAKDGSDENEFAASFNNVPRDMVCSQIVTLRATAYHEPPGSLTRSGTLSRVGAVAVDPEVIPLGTKLYVEGYGYCVAEDTGGLIKGNRIDIYLDSEAECQDWGVRNVSVYILQ